MHRSTALPPLSSLVVVAVEGKVGCHRDQIPAPSFLSRGSLSRNQTVTKNKVDQPPSGSGNDFRDGCLLAVNLGGDADTTGAIYGQLAGAFYGESSIPLAWREKLAHRGLIASFADRLLTLSEAAARSSWD